MSSNASHSCRAPTTTELSCDKVQSRDESPLAGLGRFLALSDEELQDLIELEEIHTGARMGAAEVSISLSTLRRIVRREVVNASQAYIDVISAEMLPLVRAAQQVMAARAEG